MELDTFGRLRGGNPRIEMGEVKGGKGYHADGPSGGAIKEIREVLDKREAVVEANKTALTLEGRRPILRFIIPLDEAKNLHPDVQELFDHWKKTSPSELLDIDFDIVRPREILGQ